MTDLKRISASTTTEKQDVAYLWVRSDRRSKKKRQPAAAQAARRTDPLSFPWGDIVETPIRVLRRMFNRD